MVRLYASLPGGAAQLVGTRVLHLRLYLLMKLSHTLSSGCHRAEIACDNHLEYAIGCGCLENVLCAYNSREQVVLITSGSLDMPRGGHVDHVLAVFACLLSYAFVFFIEILELCWDSFLILPRAQFPLDHLKILLQYRVHDII